MFGLILLYSTLCAADTTTKKRLATTNYVDCKLSDKVNTSSILHALRGDYDVDDVLSADVVVNMFENYYDKDYIDKQDFVEYITADDKKCFSKYSDDIWILDNPPDIDSYVVNVRIISELDDVEINASIVVENGNTTSIRNIGHYGSSDIENLWAFYPSNFTLYTTSEFRPAMSISACITSMYSGKYYSVEYIDNAITSLEDKIKTAAGGNYLSMDSVIGDKKDVYEDDDVLTYKVLKDTYASQQALTTLKDSVYSKVEVDDMLNGDYREYITADDAKCFSMKDYDTWILDNPPTASSYTLNITFKKDNTEVYDSVTVVDNKVEHHLITDTSREDYFRFNPDDFTFYINGNSAYVIFRPGNSGSSACVTAMYSGSKGVMYDYYTKDEVDNINNTLRDEIANTISNGNYLSRDNVKYASQSEYDTYDIFSARYVNSNYALKDDIPSLDNYCAKTYVDDILSGNYTEHLSGVCYTRSSGDWVSPEHPELDTYTLHITLRNDEKKSEMHVTIDVIDKTIKSISPTDEGIDFNPVVMNFIVHSDGPYADYNGGDGVTACIDTLYTGMRGYYDKDDIDNKVRDLEGKITAAASGDYIPTGNIDITVPSSIDVPSIDYDDRVLSTKACVTAFASKSSLTELSSTVTTINNKLTTDGVDNYLKRAEVINITSAIDKKQLDTHIALSADSAALIALENKDKEDQVVRKNDPDYSTLVNKSTVEDIVSRSKLYYRKDNFNFISSENICFEKDANNGFHKVHSIMPRPENTSYTIIADLYLDDARVLPCVIDVVNHSLVKSSVDGVVACAVTAPDCVGEELADNLWFRITPDSSHLPLTARVCIRSIIDKGDLNQYYTAEEVDAVAVLRGNIHETGDISQNYTPDDAHILTAAATKALITNRAHAVHDTAEFTTRVDTSDKFVYLAVEACDDDYVYEGVLPIGVLSVNEKCTLNIANNDDVISFKVVNSDDGKDEVFDIRLVVY